MRVIGTSVPYAPQRKSWYRNEIEAINRTNGMPTFFITINPADLKSPIVNILAGKTLDARLEKILTSQPDELDSEQRKLYDQHQRSSNAHNPVACAEYFELVLSQIRKHFLGYQNGHFRKCPLGYVNAFYGCVEQQQRKSLHCHMLVWVKGFESYSVFHNRMKTDNTYKECFIRYINRLIVCSINEDIENCPPLNPSAFAFQGLDNNISWSDQGKAICEWVIRKCQVHSCSVYHCMKNQKKCRYGFPRKKNVKTEYCEETGTLNIARNHNMINDFNPLLSTIFRCNNDIKFIPGLGDPSVSRIFAWYICWYSAKYDISNMKVVRALLQKFNYMNHDEIQHYSENPTKLFKTLTHRALNLMISAGEKGGPEVARFLMGHSDRVTSAEFVPIFWIQFDMYVINEIDEYTLHSYSKIHEKSYAEEFRMHPSNQFSNQIADPSKDKQKLAELMSLSNSRIDYTERPLTFEHICLYQFFAKFEKVHSSKHPSAVKFLESHPDHQVFGMKVRMKEKIILLPRFNGTSEIHGVGTESFFRLMMILFKPWRQPRDLLNNHSCFGIAYEEFKSQLEVDGMTYEYPYNVMYSFESNAQVIKSARELTRPLNEDPEGDVLIDPQDFGFEVDEIDSYSEWREVNYSDMNFLQTGDRERVWIQPNVIGTATISYNSAQNELQGLMMATRHANKQAKLDRVFHNTDRQDHVDGELTKSVSGTRTIQINCLGSDIDVYVKEVLNTMNDLPEQQGSFKLIAHHIKQTRLGQSVDQMRMLVTGEGGTGKTYLIQCITNLLKFIDRSQWLIKAAPTGRAANIIHGDTLHTAFKLNRDTSNANVLSEASEHERSIVSNARYIIIDEISMVGPSDLGQIHNFLQSSMDCQNGALQVTEDKLFAGKHYILFGDFLQFAPVGKSSLLDTSNRRSQNVQFDVLNTIGRSVFNGINRLIELRTQKRVTDPVYRDILRRIRLNDVTADDRRLLRTRIIDTNLIENHDTYVPYIVSCNTLRQKLNWQEISTHSNHNDEPLIRCDPLDRCMGVLRAADRNWLCTRSINHLDGSLLLSIGMKVILTENVFKYLGATNGALGILERVIYERTRDGDPELKCLVIRIGEAESSISVPILRTDTRTQLRFPNGKSLHVHRSQFPIAGGYAITDYKAQGSSFASAIINLNNSRGPSNYVKLSRVKSLDGLYIHSDFKDSDLKIKFNAGYERFWNNLNIKHQHALAEANSLFQDQE